VKKGVEEKSKWSKQVGYEDGSQAKALSRERQEGRLKIFTRGKTSPKRGTEMAESGGGRRTADVHA